MKPIARHALMRLGTIILIISMVFCLMPGEGEYFAYAKAKAKKPSKVKTVKLVKKTSTSIKIKWSKSSRAKKYQIKYKIWEAKKYKTVTSKKRKYLIKNLKPGTKYSIKVRGIKGKSKGKWSKLAVFATNEATSVDYAKASNESKLKVSVKEDTVTISIEPLKKKGKAALYAVKSNDYFKGDKITGIVSKNSTGTKIGSFKMNKKKTFTLDRFTDKGYDRLYDKYYIVASGKIIKGPVYATEIASSRDKVEMETKTKKGLIDELDQESFDAAKDLQCGWTALNIDFTSLVFANEKADGKPIDNTGKNADTIEVNGKTFYINRSYVSELDSRLVQYEKMGINAVGICVSFVSTEKSSKYPRALKYIDDARWTNGFNTANELGRDYFIACMEYLANRYSKGGKGLISNYVIGNEVDYTYDWYEIVPNKSKDGKELPVRGSNVGLRKNEIEVRAPFETFMEEYSRTLRLANLAVKKYSSDINVGISLSRAWAESRAMNEKCNPTKSKRYDSYVPKDMLGWLNYYSKKSGDYDWSVTPHNYPGASGDAAAFETGLTSDKATINGSVEDSPVISQNNMELTQIFLNRDYTKFNGNLREIYFTENGASSGSEVGTPSITAQKQHAAAVAQLYYRAMCMPSVKAIIYYKLTDRDAEGATSFKLGLRDTTGAKKLGYDVWKYIDTSRSFQVANKYLGGISFKKNGVVYSKEKGNINSFRDVMESVDSGYDWNKYWNEDLMTPVKLEETKDEAALSTDKTTYEADDPILVTASGSSTDLVGLYKKGETPEDEPIYSYMITGDECGVTHKSGEQYDIRAYGAVNMARAEDAKLPAGDYIVILSSGTDTLKSVDIKITGKSSYIDEKKITTDKTTYAVGEPIVVTASGKDKDWAGIYKKGETPGGSATSFYWYYVNDETHISGKPYIIQNGLTNNRAKILPAGSYYVYLLENDGYNVISRTAEITIEPGEAGNITSLSYKLDNEKDGFANGTVTVVKPEKSGATDCLMYWGDEKGEPLKQYSHLAMFRLTGEVTTHRMQPNTIIPEEARTLIARAVTDGVESEESIKIDLPEGCGYKLDTDPLFWFPVMSDTHCVNDGSGNDYNENTNYHFTDALKDIVKNLPGSAGVFVNGDIADHGKASEYKKVFNMYKSVEGAPTIHMSIGNHDWRTNNPDGQFQKYVNLFNPAVTPENVYYDEWVGGYHFIFMGGEAMGDNAELSQEQLKWVDDLLAEDSENDPTRPVFLFLHQGLQDAMSGNYAGEWGYDHGVNQDAQLKSIVSKYGQVVMFGGHTHHELDSHNCVTPGSEEIPVSVNTAAVGYLWNVYNTSAGEYMYGAHGLFLQVFSDKIYIFGRDFLSGKFMPNSMFVLEPMKLDIAKEKISLKAGGKPVNIGAVSEPGVQITYKSSDNKVASVDYKGNIRPIGEGKAKIYVSTGSSDTKAINRKIVDVTVTAGK